MSRRKRPAITTDSPIGEDVDLDRDDVRLEDGTRLTSEGAERLTEEIRKGGRPSLSGKNRVSPQIAFRVTPDVRDKAAELAARQHKTVSELAREALEEWIKAS